MRKQCPLSCQTRFPVQSFGLLASWGIHRFVMRAIPSTDAISPRFMFLCLPLGGKTNRAKRGLNRWRSSKNVETWKRVPGCRTYFPVLFFAIRFPAVFDRERFCGFRKRKKTYARCLTIKFVDRFVVKLLDSFIFEYRFQNLCWKSMHT